MAFAGRAGAANARAIARRSLRNFFRACVEMVIALESSDNERRAAIPVDGREHLDTALAKGKGRHRLERAPGEFFFGGYQISGRGPSPFTY